MSTPLSAEDLVEIDLRCREATEAPWDILFDPTVECVWLNAAGADDQAAIALFDYRSGPDNMANARLAALARRDLPRLVAEVRVLRQRVQELLEANSKEVDRRTQAMHERDEAVAKLAALGRV